MGVLLVLMTNSGKCDQAGLGAQQAAYEQENENEIRGSGENQVAL